MRCTDPATSWVNEIVDFVVLLGKDAKKVPDMTTDRGFCTVLLVIITAKGHEA